MKLYTFRMICSFTMQFTLPEQDVEQDPGGDMHEVEPTDKVLEQIQQELEEYLSQKYGAVANVDAFADSDSLLGIDEGDLD